MVGSFHESSSSASWHAAMFCHVSRHHAHHQFMLWGCQPVQFCWSWPDDYLRSTINDSIQEPNRIRTLFSDLPSAINPPFPNQPTSMQPQTWAIGCPHVSCAAGAADAYLFGASKPNTSPNSGPKQLKVQGRTTKELIADSGRYDFPIFMSRYDFL